MAQNQSSSNGAREDLAGWDRQAVTYRLTPKRKRELLALLGDGGEPVYPTEALDRAIELATISLVLDADHQPAVPSEDRNAHALAGGMSDAMRILTGLAEDWESVRTQLARVAADCAQLRSAVASTSLLADGAVVGRAYAQKPLRAWLDDQADPVTTWLVAKARWVCKRPAETGMAIWELEIRELGRNGQCQAPRVELSRVELGPALVNGPLSRLDWDGGCVMSCARSNQGWTLSLRSAGEDGKLDEPFVELSI